MRKKPKRSADQAQTTLSLPREILAECDARADALGLSRSAYIVQLLRADLATRAALVISEVTTPYGVSSEPAEPGAGRDPHSDSVLHDTLAPHLGNPRKPKRGS